MCKELPITVRHFPVSLQMPFFLIAVVSLISVGIPFDLYDRVRWEKIFPKMCTSMGLRRVRRYVTRIGLRER